MIFVLSSLSTCLAVICLWAIIKERNTAKRSLQIFRSLRATEAQRDRLAAQVIGLTGQLAKKIMNTPEWLRPSMLPKLALCGQYRSEPNAGEAAERGTKLDGYFRRMLSAENVPLGDLTSDEREALIWARDTARVLAGGSFIAWNEESLRIEVCGMTGTADALCGERNWSADLKTGQKRNYLEQQAAYALGFMDDLFADEWVVYLLFCDLREVKTFKFTREEAERIVRGAIANAMDEAPPSPNEYCGWCAKRFDCPARLEAVGFSLNEKTVVALDNARSEQLREFALRAAVVAEFDEEARRILKERIVKGEKVPGCFLSSRRGARKLPAREIELHIRQLGFGPTLAAYGDLSEAKALELWKKCPDLAFPADKIVELPGSTFVRVGRAKA